MAYVELKEFVYRNGLLTFSVPANWSVEMETNEDGDEGVLFADEGDELGILRLDLLCFQSPKPVTKDVLEALLDARQGNKPQPIQGLSNGNLLRTCWEDQEEDGESLLIHYWDLAQAHPPSGVRLAIFSYTILQELRDDEEIGFFQKLLDAQIRKAVFGEEKAE